MGTSTRAGSSPRQAPETAQPAPPAVSSCSSRLHVRVEKASTTDGPYRVVVVNKSRQAVVALRYALEGSWNTPPVQGVRRSPMHLPLIAPSQTYELPLVTNLSRASGPPTPPSWVRTTLTPGETHEVTSGPKLSHDLSPGPGRCSYAHNSCEISCVHLTRAERKQV